MDLYPLHPSVKQPPSKACAASRAPAAETDKDTAAMASQLARLLKTELVQAIKPVAAQSSTHELAKAREEAAMWRAEVAKMDKIANDATQKLQQKKADKMILKAECDKLQNEVETWKTRYKELATAQKRLAPDSQLAEAERNEIKEKLILGGKSFRELQELRPVVQKLKAEKAADAATIKKLQAENDAFTKRLGGKPAPPAVGDAAQAIRDLKLEVASGKERLRAAVTDASGKATRLMACKDMLIRAEQVLKTCSQLHSARGESTEFGEAITETSANLSKFIQALDAKK